MSEEIRTLSSLTEKIKKAQSLEEIKKLSGINKYIPNIEKIDSIEKVYFELLILLSSRNDDSINITAKFVRDGFDNFKEVHKSYENDIVSIEDDVASMLKIIKKQLIGGNNNTPKNFIDDQIEREKKLVEEVKKIVFDSEKSKKSVAVPALAIAVVVLFLLQIVILIK